MYLYAIKSALTGWIKVGRSKMPKDRLKGLQAGGTELGLDMALTLLGQVPLVNIAHETAVHRALGHARVRGEWFLGFDGAVVSFVNEVIVHKATEPHIWLGLREIRKARAAAIRPEPPTLAGVSLREFARQIGVSESAVRKAVTSGRLASSLTTGGKPFIADVALAMAAWRQSSRTVSLG